MGVPFGVVRDWPSVPGHRDCDLLQYTAVARNVQQQRDYPYPQ